jgi:transcriptional regulator with XRE-family HTH domain
MPPSIQTRIDARVRARLRAKKVNQSHLARFLRRSQGWLNKYLYGTGHATIDDIVGMAAYFGVSLRQFIGETTLPAGTDRHESVTAAERRLLRAWRRVPRDLQPAAFDLLELFARRTRRARALESTGSTASAPPEKAAAGPRRRRRA